MSAGRSSPGHAIEALRHRLRAMPKVLLHEHLDGGLRPRTVHELLRAQGLASPGADAVGVEAWFRCRAHAGSLTEYLSGFALTVQAMASPTALERVAFEAAEDARADGCVLAEFRIAPALFEAHGVAIEGAIEAMLTGLKRSALPSGLILCAMREREPSEGRRVAAAAVRYRDDGVVGFDLAGPELGYPPSVHAAALGLARDGGLALTVHAGEADSAQRIIEAARLGALRIGHGVHLAQALHTRGGAGLIDEVLKRNLHLEQCPTSNWHTGAVASLAAHPIGELWRAGISLSFHTDNRLMSMITHTDEALQLIDGCGLSMADLVAMGLQAAAHSFLPEAARAQAQCTLRAWAVREALALPP